MHLAIFGYKRMNLISLTPSELIAFARFRAEMMRES